MGLAHASDVGLGLGHRHDDHDGAFLGAIIVAVILGMRWFVGQRKNSPVDSAMIILRERFIARGEIEKDEFETKKRELS